MSRFDLWPKIETVKALATYGGGLFVLFSTMEALRYMVTLDPTTFGVAAIGIIATLASGVVNFFFGVEVGKQQQKAFEAGVNTTPAGTIVQQADNVVGGDPTIINGGGKGDGR